MSPLHWEITPADVKRQQDAGEPLHLIDVREPGEFAITRIAGAELIPMGTVPASLQKIEGLADDGTVVVICHHGVRSLQVVNWLRRQGVERCQSMTGGIERWSLEVDPLVPRY